MEPEAVNSDVSIEIASGVTVAAASVKRRAGSSCWRISAIGKPYQRAVEAGRNNESFGYVEVVSSKIS
jgi:hypothetical protein